MTLTLTLTPNQVPDVYNGRLMSLLLARLDAVGLEPGLSPPLPSPTEGTSAPDQGGGDQGGGGQRGGEQRGGEQVNPSPSPNP